MPSNVHMIGVPRKVGRRRERPIPDAPLARVQPLAKYSKRAPDLASLPGTKFCIEIGADGNIVYPVPIVQAAHAAALAYLLSDYCSHLIKWQLEQSHQGVESDR